MNKKFGLIELGWGDKILLPLDTAHKIQALLCDGMKAAVEYSAGGGYITASTYKVPDVSVVSVPVFDATMLTKAELEEWTAAVKQGLAAEGTDAARDVVTPAAWLKMTR